jgi:hypothetical protein
MRQTDQLPNLKVLHIIGEVLEPKDGLLMLGIIVLIVHEAILAPAYHYAKATCSPEPFGKEELPARRLV